jgi:transposase
MLKNIFKNYYNEIIEIINVEVPMKRKYKINNEYCLEKIYEVLKTGISWNNLYTINCHYSTIYKRFKYWVKLNIFNKIWNYILQEYTNKQLLKDKLHFKTLFIDSTMVRNHLGYQCIGRNYQDRFRNATKISIICDNNKIPLCSLYYPGNIHDSITIEDSLNSLNNILINDKRYHSTLVADKGYIIDKEKRNNLLNNFKIKLLTPYRNKSKKQKKKENKKEKKIIKDKKQIKMNDKYLLSIRYKIENVFNRLDQYKRIKYREDRLLNTFIAFNELAMTSIIIIFLNNK